MSTAPPSRRDARLPRRQRVDDLLAQLTLDERIAMLHQFAPAVERLRIAAFRTGQEALHGVAWMGPATVFPQAVGLGASWNPDLLRRIGEAVSTEVRGMRARDPRVGLNVWAPVVNPLRDPRWGRNEEGYSEDPALTAALATAYTRGLRGGHPRYWRTAPVLKHWLAHNNETGRDTTSASVPPRVLHEYDLPAFRGPVEAGAVAGVMPAYSLVNGRPNHLSPYLEQELRTWTDRELVVCSDAAAPSNIAGSQGYHATHEEAAAAALRAGVDSFTDHDQDPAPTIARVRGALERGLIGEHHIDTAVRRLLAMRRELGEFDPEDDPYAGLGPEHVDTPAHRELAREAAEQAVVLLKNDGLLPLSAHGGGGEDAGVGADAAGGAGTVAVIGPMADACKRDWYSGDLIRRSTLRGALAERLGAGRVVHADGSDRVRLRCASGGWLYVPAGAGAPEAAPGSAGSLNPAHTEGRTDLPPVTRGEHPTELALTDWGGGVLTLHAPDGHCLSAAADGFVRASAEEPGGWVVQETFVLDPHGDGHLLRHLGSGRLCRLTPDGLRTTGEGEGPESAEVFTVEVTERGEDAAARAAAAAGTVIVAAGNDPHINGRETEDRTTLALPPAQERLPQTWYAGDDGLPGLFDYDIIGARATYLYFDGTPLYPFGHGLSYSRFSYDGLTVTRDGDTLTAVLTVTNTGDRDADEVVQLYARAVAPRVPRPHRQLVAHERRRLAAGETGRFAFTVPVAALGHWDVAHGRWTTDPGRYELQAGASSADIRLTAPVAVGGPPPAPRPVRESGLEAAHYDASGNAVLVDRTKTRGDAVAPADPGAAARLLFRACDFGPAAPDTAVLLAARAEPGEARIGLALADGTPLGEAVVPCTDGPYAYRAVELTLGGAPRGVRDLWITLRGAVRLARLDFGLRDASREPSRAAGGH